MSNQDLEKQASDMVMTEEELDYLATLKVKARSEGRAEGRTEERREIATAMLAEGDSVEKVVRISKLTENEVLAIKASLEH